MHAIAHRGVQTQKKSLHWKLTLGEKSLATPGNWTCTCVSGVPVQCSTRELNLHLRQWCASPMFYQLSCIPIQALHTFSHTHIYIHTNTPTHIFGVLDLFVLLLCNVWLNWSQVIVCTCAHSHKHTHIHTNTHTYTQDQRQFCSVSKALGNKDL